MFKIAVCDKDRAACAFIESVIWDYSERNIVETEIEFFDSGQELIREMQAGKYFDLLFLEIKMQPVGGRKVGMMLREQMRNKTTQIVFLSATQSCALDLFQYRPLCFIMKPIKEEEIRRLVEQCMELCGRNLRIFQFQQENGLCKVPIRDILYLKLSRWAVKLKTAEREYSFHSTLDEAYEELKDCDFFYCNKTILVNYHSVNRFQYNQLIMSNGEVLPVAQPKRKEIEAFQIKLERTVYW